MGIEIALLSIVYFNLQAYSLPEYWTTSFRSLLILQLQYEVARIVRVHIEVVGSDEYQRGSNLHEKGVDLLQLYNITA